MSKQIVVCVDGTWNDPTEKTNVYQMFRMLPGKENKVASSIYSPTIRPSPTATIAVIWISTLCE